MKRLSVLSIFTILTATSIVIFTTTADVVAQNATNSTNINTTNGSLQHEAVDNLELESGLNNATADTKWAKYFLENPGYENVTVVYESPNLVVLDSRQQELLDVKGGVFWKAVDNVLLDGYNLTAIISDDQVILTK